MVGKVVARFVRLPNVHSRNTERVTTMAEYDKVAILKELAAENGTFLEKSRGYPNTAAAVTLSQ